MKPNSPQIFRTTQPAVFQKKPDEAKLTRLLFSRLAIVMVVFLASSGGPSAFSAKANAIDEDALDEKQIAWFENKVRPLLAAKCYSCHSAKDGNDEGGLTLDTKLGWKEGGDLGPAIVPLDADASLLIRAVRYQDSDLEMPPDRKLADSEIAILERWVKLGAPDPRTGESSATPKIAPSDPIAGKEHWAFQPLKRPVVPALTEPFAELEADRDSIRNPVDSFVLRRLKQAGLKPSPTADRRTLARRLHVTLTGLAPSTSEMNEFLNNNSPDAYPRLVDRLLSTNAFGESWGRHWLDLARYADSNGLDENFLFREAWRYRNWVIDSVNSDQPYDRFLLEQLAGDLLPFDSIEERDRQRIGAGFLVIGPKVLLGVNGEQQRMDVADEQIDTVGRAILGQTLGCARCHDHKFDPIPTKDYYAMAGVFASTKVMQMRYMLGQQRLMERLVGLGEEENKVNAEYEKYWRERGKLKERLDQAKKALELFKKKETKLLDLKGKFTGAVSAKIIDVIKAEIESQKPAPPFPFDSFKPLALATRVEIQSKFVAELERQFNQPPPIPPRAMIPADASKPTNEAIRIAGQFNRKGEVVERGFLQVVSREPSRVANDSSGRLELAQWLTDRENGAAHLSARVMANRVWHHLVGQGIVKTTDNFGRTGQAPTHPELLDYLAMELIESDWSVKKLIRTIVMSQTFRQSSVHNDSANEIDPDNRLVWRANRRRLSPEAFRDSILVAAEEIDRKQIDSTVSYLGDQATAVGANTNRRKTDYSFRSVYLPVIRNDLPELFEVFDFADAHRATGNRAETTVATQGLYVLNDDWVMKLSRKLAAKLIRMSQESTTPSSDSMSNPKEQPGLASATNDQKSRQDSFVAKQVYSQILNQSASDSEIQQLVEFVKQIQAGLQREDAMKLQAKDATQKTEMQKSKKTREGDTKTSQKKSSMKQNVSKESKTSPTKNAAVKNTAAKSESGEVNSDEAQAEQHASALHAEIRLRAWALACHAMFASSRFQILE